MRRPLTTAIVVTLPGGRNATWVGRRDHGSRQPA